MTATVVLEILARRRISRKTFSARRAGPQCEVCLTSGFAHEIALPAHVQIHAGGAATLSGRAVGHPHRIGQPVVADHQFYGGRRGLSGRAVSTRRKITKMGSHANRKGAESKKERNWGWAKAESEDEFIFFSIIFFSTSAFGPLRFAPCVRTYREAAGFPQSNDARSCAAARCWISHGVEVVSANFVPCSQFRPCSWQRPSEAARLVAIQDHRA